jgi:hypothetical protein
MTPSRWQWSLHAVWAVVANITVVVVAVKLVLLQTVVSILAVSK